ncbi:MAG: GNAT family N-acetyltransferase [Planctomycetes bacterium]|nr:GNAT family N-acetyltransferase [Planctomycetota bacterium]
MSVEIIQTSAAQLYAIRHRNLRIGQPVGTERMPGIDENPHTVHLLLRVNGEGVGCATFMPEQNQNSKWRLRGMAIDEGYRRRGYGKKLIDFFTLKHGSSIWCNARTSACKFYQYCGFVAEGDEFDIALIGPHYVMRYTS